MDKAAVRNTRSGLLVGRSPLLRFQSDERLIALIRSGHDGAFELLFERYRPRLLSFCRHMLGSKEDAEDVLQEVFAASYNAMRADNRELNVRPWLYRIARNRCLNHLRRPRPDGRDTMDDQIGGHGVTTADIVHKRVDFRHLLEDIHKLPETQRTALLLREIDVLSYEQIADAMETTVPSVKSLLVRARMSLAEAAEARQLTCNDVRRELAEIAEGLKKSSPQIRRHLRDCEQCGTYRTQLRKTSTAMAIAFPLGPVLMLKKLFLAKLGLTAAAGGGSAVATKAITVTAATALLAGGAVEVQHLTKPAPPPPKQAIVQPQKPQFQSGGQAAATLPSIPAVKEQLKAADEKATTTTTTEEKPANTVTTDETTTTPTDAEPVAPTGTTDPATVTAPEDVVPVEGQSTPPTSGAQTGGAPLPPPTGQTQSTPGTGQAAP